MDDREANKEKETVIVERQRGSAGGVIAAVALLLVVLGALKYFGLLPL